MNQTISHLLISAIAAARGEVVPAPKVSNKSMPQADTRQSSIFDLAPSVNHDLVESAEKAVIRLSGLVSLLELRQDSEEAAGLLGQLLEIRSRYELAIDTGMGLNDLPAAGEFDSFFKMMSDQVERLAPSVVEPEAALMDLDSQDAVQDWIRAAAAEIVEPEEELAAIEPEPRAFVEPTEPIALDKADESEVEVEVERALASTEGTPYLPGAAGGSQQYDAYSNWILSGGELSQGLVEQIAIDERLEDGESDKLLAQIVAMQSGAPVTDAASSAIPPIKKVSDQDKPSQTAKSTSDSVLVTAPPVVSIPEGFEERSVQLTQALEAMVTEGVISARDAVESKAAFSVISSGQVDEQLQSALSDITGRNAGIALARTYAIPGGANVPLKVLLQAKVTLLDAQRINTTPEAKLKKDKGDASPVVADREGGGRQAKAGGEQGLNGEWYEGGQFMPASAFTVKGAHQSESDNNKGSKLVLIAPGEMGVVPEGQSSIFGKIREFIEPTEAGMVRNFRGDSTLANFGLTPDGLQNLIDRFNTGDRYFSAEDMAADVESLVPLQTIDINDQINALVATQSIYTIIFALENLGVNLKEFHGLDRTQQLLQLQTLHASTVEELAEALPNDSKTSTKCERLAATLKTLRFSISALEDGQEYWHAPSNFALQDAISPDDIEDLSRQIQNAVEDFESGKAISLPWVDLPSSRGYSDDYSSVINVAQLGGAQVFNGSSEYGPLCYKRNLNFLTSEMPSWLPKITGREAMSLFQQHRAPWGSLTGATVNFKGAQALVSGGVSAYDRPGSYYKRLFDLIAEEYPALFAVSAEQTADKASAADFEAALADRMQHIANSRKKKSDAPDLLEETIVISPAEEPRAAIFAWNNFDDAFAFDYMEWLESAHPEVKGAIEPEAYELIKIEAALTSYREDAQQLYLERLKMVGSKEAVERLQSGLPCEFDLNGDPITLLPAANDMFPSAVNLSFRNESVTLYGYEEAVMVALSRLGASPILASLEASQAHSSKPTVAKDLSFEELVAVIRRWQGAGIQYDDSRYENWSYGAELELYAYIERNFGIKEHEARQAYFHVVRNNLGPDMTVNLDEFEGESWAGPIKTLAPEFPTQEESNRSEIDWDGDEEVGRHVDLVREYRILEHERGGGEEGELKRKARRKEIVAELRTWTKPFIDSFDGSVYPSTYKAIAITLAFPELDSYLYGPNKSEAVYSKLLANMTKATEQTKGKRKKIDTTEAPAEEKPTNLEPLSREYTSDEISAALADYGFSAVGNLYQNHQALILLDSGIVSASSLRSAIENEPNRPVLASVDVDDGRYISTALERIARSHNVKFPHTLSAPESKLEIAMGAAESLVEAAGELPYSKFVPSSFSLDKSIQRDRFAKMLDAPMAEAINDLLSDGIVRHAILNFWKSPTPESRKELATTAERLAMRWAGDKKIDINSANDNEFNPEVEPSVQNNETLDDSASLEAKDEDEDEITLAVESTIKIAADSLEQLRPSDVERVVSYAADISDDLLAKVYETIFFGSKEQSDALEVVFSEMAPFYTESENRYIRNRAKSAMWTLNAGSLRKTISSTYGENLAGLELSNDKKDLFVFFQPDASSPGKFRYTYFSSSGFTGHSTFNSYKEALNDAIQSGYRNLANGALEELSQEATFKDGNAWASRLQEFNSGKISWEQFTGTAAVASTKEVPVIEKTGAIQPKADIPLSEGDRFKTQSGNTTTPFPKANYKTESMNTRNVNAWLKENAIDEANRRGDSFNVFQFENLDIKNWSQSDGDGVNLYLFGDETGRIGRLNWAYLQGVSSAEQGYSSEYPSNRKSKTDRAAFSLGYKETKARLLESQAAPTQENAQPSLNQEIQPTSNEVNTNNNFITQTKHTKKGHDLFVIQLADRVSREKYKELENLARSFHGWYSLFEGDGAVPGFQFKNREDAESYLASLISSGVAVVGQEVDASAPIKQEQEADTDDILSMDLDELFSSIEAADTPLDHVEAEEALPEEKASAPVEVDETQAAYEELARSLPATSSMVKLVLKNAPIGATFIEHEGKYFVSRTRTNTRDMGNALTDVRRELGTPGNHSLITTDRRALTVKIGGAGTTSQRGVITVADTQYEEISAKELAEFDIDFLSKSQLATPAPEALIAQEAALLSLLTTPDLASSDVGLHNDNFLVFDGQILSAAIPAHNDKTRDNAIVALFSAMTKSRKSLSKHMKLALSKEPEILSTLNRHPAIEHASDEDIDRLWALMSLDSHTPLKVELKRRRLANESVSSVENVLNMEQKAKPKEDLEQTNAVVQQKKEGNSDLSQDLSSNEISLTRTDDGKYLVINGDISDQVRAMVEEYGGRWVKKLDGLKIKTALEPRVRRSLSKQSVSIVDKIRKSVEISIGTMIGDHKITSIAPPKEGSSDPQIIYEGQLSGGIVTTKNYSSISLLEDKFDITVSNKKELMQDLTTAQWRTKWLHKAIEQSSKIQDAYASAIEDTKDYDYTSGLTLNKMRQLVDVEAIKIRALRDGDPTQAIPLTEVPVVTCIFGQPAILQGRNENAEPVYSLANGSQVRLALGEDGLQLICKRAMYDASGTLLPSKSNEKDYKIKHEDARTIGISLTEPNENMLDAVAAPFRDRDADLATLDQQRLISLPPKVVDAFFEKNVNSSPKNAARVLAGYLGSEAEFDSADIYIDHALDDLLKTLKAKYIKQLKLLVIDEEIQKEVCYRLQHRNDLSPIPRENAARRLSGLYERSAELTFNVEAMLIDEADLQHYREHNTDEIYTYLCSKYKFSQDAARQYVDRLSEELGERHKAAYLASPEFILGQKAAEILQTKLPANCVVTAATGQYQPAIAVRFGAGSCTISVPELRDDEYIVYFNHSDLQNNKTKASGIHRYKNLPTPEALAKDAESFLACNRVRLTQVWEAPHYGSRNPDHAIKKDSEISKLIRNNVKQAMLNHYIPTGVSVSVRIANGGILMTLKQLPKDFDLYTPKYKEYILDARKNGYTNDCMPDIFTPEGQALVSFLEAELDAYNYRYGDRDSNYYSHFEICTDLKDQQVNRASDPVPPITVPTDNRLGAGVASDLGFAYSEDGTQRAGLRLSKADSKMSIEISSATNSTIIDCPPAMQHFEMRYHLGVAIAMAVSTQNIEMDTQISAVLAPEDVSTATTIHEAAPDPFYGRSTSVSSYN